MLDKTSDCKKISPLLDAFHDGELLDEERLSIARHLPECKMCQGQLQEIERVVASLQNLPRLIMEPDLKVDWQALMEAPSDARAIADSQSVDKIAAASKGKDSSSAYDARLGLLLHFGRYRSSLLAVAATVLLFVLVGSIWQWINIARPFSIANQSIDQTNKIVQTADRDLLALYPNESNLVSEDLGIATNEDGLYALKL